MRKTFDQDEIYEDIDFRRYLLDYLEIYNKTTDLLDTRQQIKTLHPLLTTEYLNALQYHATCELAIKGKPKIVVDSHVTIYQTLLKKEIENYKQGKVRGPYNVLAIMKQLESLLKLTDKATIKLFFDNKKLSINMGDLNMIRENINKLPMDKKNMLLEGLKLSQPQQETVDMDT